MNVTKRPGTPPPPPPATYDVTGLTQDEAEALTAIVGSITGGGAVRSAADRIFRELRAAGVDYAAYRPHIKTDMHVSSWS